ncbi:hypothetical protein ABGB12_03530 [Actinocorallia sp. B10E7]|uniref:hypothetical protein n=1 Tax=Actinocorallia sp. B10E7 TaxID=3153558 RepID=UPI00325D482A
MSGGGAKPDERKKKKGNGGWIGCLIVLAAFALTVVLPIGWSLWDEGAFDPDLSDDMTAVALGPAETARLAERLQEASRRHGICYGWEVDADTGAPVEVGSNLGAGVDARKADKATCPEWIVLKADYFYLDKEWSSVGYTVLDSYDAVQFSLDELTSSGVLDGTELGERGVAQLADAIGSLPLLAAEADLAPALPAQEQVFSPSATVDDELDSGRGAGWWFLVGLGSLLVGLGLLWIIRSAVKEWKWRRGL